MISAVDIPVAFEYNATKKKFPCGAQKEEKKMTHLHKNIQKFCCEELHVEAIFFPPKYIRNLTVIRLRYHIADGNVDVFLPLLFLSVETREI